MRAVMRAYMEANQPVTARQAAADLGMTHQSFYHHRNEMHIQGWTTGLRGQATALFVLGKGRNAVKPTKKDVNQRNREYRKRHAAIIESRRPGKRKLALGPWSGLL